MWRWLWLLPLALPPVVQAQYDFATNSDGSLDITRYTGSDLLVNIPGATNNVAVTTIDFAAFAGTGVTNVIIPNSITSLGEDAFDNCTNLVSVTLGTNIAYLPSDTFNNCGNLAGVLVPEGITSIGYEAFYRCTSLAGVAFPNSLASIGADSFANCSSLTNVIIPANVASVAAGAFNNCTNLQAIMVATNNPGYVSADGVLFSHQQSTLVEYPAGKTNCSYTVPASVTTISGEAFSGCSRLVAVNFPPGLTRIQTEAFFGCLRLASISIPGGVPEINQETFSGCGALTNVCIGNGVASIDDEAFEGCTNLTGLTLGKNVASIGQFAFSGCEGIVNITFPAGLQNIGLGAFALCSGLDEAYFQGNAPAIFIDSGPIMPPYVFSGNTNLTVYCLPSATGWGAKFSGAPVAVWDPMMQAVAQAGGVIFHITGPTNASVVVEACANLAAPAWSPVATNQLAGGTSDFQDPQAASFSARYYRLRSP